MVESLGRKRYRSTRHRRLMSNTPALRALPPDSWKNQTRWTEFLMLTKPWDSQSVCYPLRILMAVLYYSFVVLLFQITRCFSFSLFWCSFCSSFLPRFLVLFLSTVSSQDSTNTGEIGRIQLQASRSINV